MAADSELAVWSWRPKNSAMQNFGDELGPQFMELLGYRTRRVPLAEAELVTAGSILQTAIVKGRDGLTVWGSGLIKPRAELPSRTFNIVAVRGRLTAAALELPDQVALGDPGLLASRFWKRPPVRHRVGVVPHYVDKNTYPWADVTIDVRQPVEQVVAQIASCATIVSSSLHGIIIAQSYGIPAMRLQHGKVVGGNYKWADFQTAVDRDISAVQDDLIAALERGLNEPRPVVTAALHAPAKPAAPPEVPVPAEPPAPKRRGLFGRRA